MKFHVNAQELRFRINSASRILNTGASVALKSASSDKFLSLLISADKERGEVVFVSENGFGAAFRSVLKTEVEEGGTELVSIPELSTVSGVFSSSEEVLVESVYSDLNPDAPAYAVEVSTSNISASARTILLPETIPAPEFAKPAKKADSFSISLEDFIQIWNTGSVSHASMNDRTKTLKFVYLSLIDEGDNLRVLSTNGRSFSFASSPVNGDASRFDAVIYPDNLDSVIGLLSDSGSEMITFYINSPEEEVERIINVAGFKAPEKGSEKSDKKKAPKPVIEIRFPTGNADPMAFIEDKFSALIAKSIDNYVGTIKVDTNEFLGAMGNASNICNLIPDLTDGASKEVMVSIPEDSDEINFSLPQDRFDQTIMAESSLEESVDMKIKWGAYSSHFRAALSGESLNIAVFKNETKRGLSYILCLHSNGDWDYTEHTYPDTWVVLTQGEPVGNKRN